MFLFVLFFPLFFPAILTNNWNITLCYIKVYSVMTQCINILWSDQTMVNFHQFSSFQSLSCVWLFVTPWTAAHQASFSITSSQSLLKFMSIMSMSPSNHLILCRPLLFPFSIFPSITVFSDKSVLCIRWP